MGKISIIKFQIYLGLDTKPEYLKLFAEPLYIKQPQFIIGLWKGTCKQWRSGV